MENMDKGLTLPKWVLIVWPKIHQMPKIYLPKLFAQAPNLVTLMKKRLHWVSIVRVQER